MSEINFADADSSRLEAAVLTEYEKIAQTTLYPDNPVRLFLESLAYIIAMQNNVINLAGRQNLLQFATGDHLDYIGQMVNTARLGTSHASAIQKFVLQESLDYDVLVPAGTRVTTADGLGIFVTQQDLKIPAGSISGETAVLAQKDGAGLNGLVEGQINKMIDPVPYIHETANVSMTMLGADAEPDDRYRQRIQLAPEAYTCAGPVNAYIYHAKKVHQDIAEVAVASPFPGVVDIIPVMKNGELPTEALLDQIRAAVNADNVRPLTDTVHVQAPEIVNFDIDFTWYMSKGSEALLETTKNAVADAVEKYRIWQRAKPGRDIMPLPLVANLERAGVRRIELRSPKYTILDYFQLAREGKISMIYGGAESE